MARAATKCRRDQERVAEAENECQSGFNARPQRTPALLLAHDVIPTCAGLVARYGGRCLLLSSPPRRGHRRLSRSGSNTGRGSGSALRWKGGIPGAFAFSASLGEWNEILSCLHCFDG